MLVKAIVIAKQFFGDKNYYSSFFIRVAIIVNKGVYSFNIAAINLYQKAAVIN